jgi:hypothetical protein
VDIVLIPYTLLCVVVSIFGRKSNVGFWGILLASFLLTPVLVFYALIALKPSEQSDQTAISGAIKKRVWGKKSV